MTFLAAGHETTATALTWAIYIICIHPEIQDKLRNEICSCLPRPLSTCDSFPADLSTIIDSGMPYLNAVCLEVFRYFSPVPVTFREAIKDTYILQTPVPAVTPIVLAPRVTNRDRTLWDSDAHIFNPDRWVSQGKQNASNNTISTSDDSSNGPVRDRIQDTPTWKKSGSRSNFAMMTFLHGPRSCIGQSFAKE
jgi:cytochrome P450